MASIKLNLQGESGLSKKIADMLGITVEQLDKVDGKADDMVEVNKLSEKFDKIVKIPGGGQCENAYLIDNGDGIIGVGDLFIHADGKYVVYLGKKYIDANLGGQSFLYGAIPTDYRGDMGNHGHVLTYRSEELFKKTELPPNIAELSPVMQKEWHDFLLPEDAITIKKALEGIAAQPLSQIQSLLGGLKVCSRTK